VRSLDLLEPYGNANPKPLMCASAVRLEAMSEVGGGKHTRLRIRMGNAHFECIFFSHNAVDTGVHEGDLIDLAFTPQINEYRGNVSVQLVAAAVRAHDPRDLCDAILREQADYEWAAAAYCPERIDFIRIWRGMHSDFHVGGSTDAVVAQCPEEMEPEKFCLCLMALREVGLLVGPDGAIYNAAQQNISGKADLEATKLISSLRSFQ
jgi:hypothetical protein